MSTLPRLDQLWKTPTLVQTFLGGVRGGIPFAAEQIDVMLRLVRARGEGVESFVDLGCGNGILAQALLAQYPHARGILIDFSEPMLNAARTSLADVSSNLRFALADFGAKNWLDVIESNARFDAIVSGFAIHHQPDTRKHELFHEIFDRLKPSGIFINVEHVASPTKWVERLSDELLIDSIYAYQSKRGESKSREQVAAEYVHRPDKAANILAPAETQCVWLREIGFQDVDCYFKAFELAVFGGRRYEK